MNIIATDLFAIASYSSPLPESLEYGLNDLARKPLLWPVSPGTDRRSGRKSAGLLIVGTAWPRLLAGRSTQLYGLQPWC